MKGVARVEAVRAEVRRRVVRRILGVGRCRPGLVMRLLETVRKKRSF